MRLPIDFKQANHLNPYVIRPVLEHESLLWDP